MKSIYDVYNKLQRSGATAAVYYAAENSIEYRTQEYTVTTFEENNTIKAKLSYDGQTFLFFVPDYFKLYELLSDLSDNKLTLERISDISIKLSGYCNTKTKQFSKPKAVILSAIGCLLGIFSLIMFIDLPVGSLIYDETFDWAFMAIDILFLTILLICISLIKYAVLQHKYKRHIWMVIIGYALSGFFATVGAVMMIDDYDKINGYDTATIGALGVMVIFVIFGIVLLIGSKRSQMEKTMYLCRTPLLPDTAEADSIFRYMNEACIDGKVSYDEIVSTGRDADWEIDLFMRYGADKLSIKIDETLLFDEILTACSQSVADSYADSNIAKYYDDEY